jgi:hypothetical protein
VEFVVDKVALGHVSFSESFGFTLSVSFHRGSPYSYIIRGMNNRPFGGRSSETLSNPVNINNSKHSLIAMVTSVIQLMTLSATM